MKIESYYPFLFIILTLITGILAGCEDRNISPFEESSGAYSIYGALEISKIPNYIRVKNVKMPFLSDSAKTMDAKVIFEDLQEGTRTELRDTVVNFSGNYTHNFIVNQQLEHEKKYKLTVEGPDGETVTSTATTPSITEVVLSTGENTLSEDHEVACREELTFTYKNVPEPESVRMDIGFKHNGKYHWDEVGFVDQLKHADNADEMFLTLSPRQLLVEVFPPPGTLAGRDPRFLSPTVKCDELDSKEVRVEYIHFGPEWDNIKGESGPTNPTESLDVENGLGFLGAYRKGTFTFDIL